MRELNQTIKLLVQKNMFEWRVLERKKRGRVKAGIIFIFDLRELYKVYRNN